MAYGELRPFGLQHVTFVKDSTTVTLAASQTMNFTPRMIGGELKGNDQIVSVASRIEALEWSLEAGGMPLDAIALVLGHTVSASGSTPNRTDTITLHAGTNAPYFKIYGQSLGEDGDDVHVKIWRAKVTGNVEGQFAYGEFYVTKMTGIAVEDSVNGLVDIIQNETSATLPTS